LQLLQNYSRYFISTMDIIASCVGHLSGCGK